MKNSIWHLLLLVVVFNMVSCSDKNESTTSESGTIPVFIADPTIFKHNGIYYLYGTSQGSLTNKGNGFLAFTSDDLINWEGPIGSNDGFALKEGDAYGTQGFWAPQIIQYNNTFYMAYTANEKIAIAQGDSPLGPFTNAMLPIDNASQIDPFIFMDDDGKIYLYHVRLNNGNRIYVAEMNTDLQSIKPETLTEILSAGTGWENTANASWTVAEGPTVFKQDGLYYLIYSTNDFRNQDYAVGYATSTSPTGPWTKAANNPIIHGNMIGEYGAGHGDLFFDENNTMQYVLHTHFSSSVVHPRKSGIIELNLNGQNITSSPETFEFFKQIVN